MSDHRKVAPLDGRRGIFVVLTLALALPGAPLRAQQGTEDEENEGVEEVVVTAQRREQSLQDVPIAVSAFSEQQLQDFQITEALDLARAVPNMIAHNNTGLGSANTYSLRGLNNTETIATFDPPVGTYVDDIYISRQNANNFAFFDVERVEVLRGPQGTLFGRNATGGAVNVILEKPRGEFGGRFAAGYGEFDRRRVNLSVDTPVSDGFLTKFSAYYVEDDGWVDNPTTGEDDMNYERSYGVRGAFRWFAGESVTWDASLAYLDSEHANTLNFEQGGDRISNSGLRADGTPFAGLISGEKQFFGRGNVTESLLFTSDVTVDTGFGVLSFITGYLSLEQDFALDFFDGPFPTGAFAIVNEGEHDQFSQEIKLTGTSGDGRWDYVAGFYYLDEDNDTDFADVFTLDIGTPTGLPIVLADRILANTTEAWALYGQADYRLNDQWTLTLGARYTDEEKAIAFTPNGEGGFDSDDIAAAGIPLSQSEALVTPRVALQYAPTEDRTWFASATRGFKSGGWNARGTAANLIQPFDPEKVWSYELGLRASWRDNRLRTNITAFFADIEDYQLPSAFEDPETGGITFITRNFADLEVQGVEAELVAQPTPNLNLFANVGIQDSEYTNLDPSILAQQAACRGGDAASCGIGIVAPDGSIAEPVRTPGYTISVGFTWQGDLGAYVLRPTLLANIVDDQWTGTSNTPESFGNSRTVVSGGLTFEPRNGPWAVTLECDNCTDENYVVAALGGFPYLDDPRTWMLRYQHRF